MSFFNSYDKDFKSFMDGGSKVPFSAESGKYFPTPYNIIEQLEFDNKLYIKTPSGYCVGTRLSTMVRSITAQDYRYVQKQLQSAKQAKQLLNKTQLVMEFC
jgi:hypothetical protein